MALDFLKKFIKNKSWLKIFLVYFFVFSFFFSIFYYIQLSFPYLAGTDAYYHIKHSWLIRTQGIEKTVRSFPWIEYSIIRDRPADLWFGYHILLFPFTFGDLIFGAKLSAVLFASLVFLGFFWVLRGLKIKYAFFWMLFLFFVTHHSFSFRLLLARPYVLSILFSLLGIYFISQKKYLALFLLSLFWAFVSPEVLLIGVMGFLWVAIEYWKERKIDWKILCLPSLGIFLGLLMRPDFPNNIYLLYHQVFSVLFLRFAGVKLNFGQELTRPFAFQSIKLNLFIFLTFVLLFFYIFLSLIDKKLKKVPTFHLFLFSLVFIFGTVTVIKSIRFIEYWAPFTVLFGAVVFNSIVLPRIPKVFYYFKSFKNYNLPPTPKHLEIYQKIYRIIRTTLFFLERKSVKLCIKAAFFLFLFYFVVLQIILTSRSWTDPFYIRSLKRAAEWLQENTPPGSLVMNKPWHNFSFLFFYNHQNHYALGMDPTFMYIKDPRLYWLWYHIPGDAIICDREECPEIDKELNDGKVHQIFKEEFKADYLLLEIPKTLLFKEKKDKEEEIYLERFRETLQKSKYFEKVFKRGQIEIYKVK